MTNTPTCDSALGLGPCATCGAGDLALGDYVVGTTDTGERLIRVAGRVVALHLRNDGALGSVVVRPDLTDPANRAEGLTDQGIGYRPEQVTRL